jgi:DNA-binding PadR family transcriptional regulator
MKRTNLYKGSLTTIILKLLNEHDKMYGYQITQKVMEITKGELQLTEGALYPALHKLEAQGLLVVEVRNRIRKYYRLTEAGTKETVDKLAELERYIRNMRALVNPKFRDV